MKSQPENDWKKYVLVFFITVTLFGGAFWLSDFFNSRRIIEIKNIQDTVSIDILTSETKFALLEELSCEDVSSSVLSQELNSLAEKIDYTEKTIGSNNEQMLSLKNFYTLLQIKDFLLARKAIAECGSASTNWILYFYTNTDCEACTRQGHVLTALREKYPTLRVYAFDAGLQNSALQALIQVYKVDMQNMPTLIINGKTTTGFNTIEQVEEKLPKALVEAAKKQLEDADSESDSVQADSKAKTN